MVRCAVGYTGGLNAQGVLEPMVTSATAVEDPSLNSRLINPCVESFGAHRVAEYLVRLGESTDPRRVVGAIDATYWTRHSTTDGLFERRKLFLLEACVSAGTREYARDRI